MTSDSVMITIMLLFILLIYISYIIIIYYEILHIIINQNNSNYHEDDVADHQLYNAPMAFVFAICHSVAVCSVQAQNRSVSIMVCPWSGHNRPIPFDFGVQQHWHHTLLINTNHIPDFGEIVTLSLLTLSWAISGFVGDIMFSIAKKLKWRSHSEIWTLPDPETRGKNQSFPGWMSRNMNQCCNEHTQ